jgi:hypothetical protein
MSEACCTCATLLSSIPLTYDEKTEKPTQFERRLDCCGRAICARCLTDNPRFANYCPFCQISTGPSPLPAQGLRVLLHIRHTLVVKRTMNCRLTQPIMLFNRHQRKGGVQRARLMSCTLLTRTTTRLHRYRLVMASRLMHCAGPTRCLQTIC